MDPRGAAGDAGFSLLEVITGLAITALMLAVLVHAAVLGLSAARTERDTAEALLRAKAHLAEVSAMPALIPGLTTGTEDNGFRWRVQVARGGVAPPFRPLRLAGGVYALDTALYEVAVSVSWNNGAAARAVTLTSHVLIPVRNGP
jgi:prepilin-type N-terminal cleavage/methylation domain-containing protein